VPVRNTAILLTKLGVRPPVTKGRWRREGGREGSRCECALEMVRKIWRKCREQHSVFGVCAECAGEEHGYAIDGGGHAAAGD